MLIDVHQLDEGRGEIFEQTPVVKEFLLLCTSTR